MDMVRRLFVACLAAGLVPFLFWSGGFDFERGEFGFLCALLTIVAGYIAFVQAA